MTNLEIESFVNQEQSKISKEHIRQELEKAYDKETQENTIKRKLEESDQTEGPREDTEEQIAQEDFTVDGLKTPIAWTTQLWQSAPLIRE